MALKQSYRLDELTWIDAAAHLARDSRLIIPVGALEQHGPHLPLGCNVLIAKQIAADLAMEFGVLLAPALHYGVNVAADLAFAGTASLSRKTLHRALNELLADWERHGVTEFILVTAHDHEPHLESLAGLLTRSARVRVVDVWDIDIADLLEKQAGPLHGCEAETSLMLHLYPELVRMDRARDFDLPEAEFERYVRGALPAPPRGSAGAVGFPRCASSAKGARIYGRMLDAIRGAVFVAPVNRGRPAQ